MLLQRAVSVELADGDEPRPAPAFGSIAQRSRPLCTLHSVRYYLSSRPAPSHTSQTEPRLGRPVQVPGATSTLLSYPKQLLYVIRSRPPLDRDRGKVEPCMSRLLAASPCRGTICSHAEPSLFLFRRLLLFLLCLVVLLPVE